MIFIMNCGDFCLVGVGEHVVERHSSGTRTGWQLETIITTDLSDILRSHRVVLEPGNWGQWLEQTQRFCLG
jgi:putative SOS response-associated peptidase YedK